MIPTSFYVNFYIKKWGFAFIFINVPTRIFSI